MYLQETNSVEIDLRESRSLCVCSSATSLWIQRVWIDRGAKHDSCCYSLQGGLKSLGKAAEITFIGHESLHCPLSKTHGEYLKCVQDQNDNRRNQTHHCWPEHGGGRPEALSSSAEVLGCIELLKGTGCCSCCPDSTLAENIVDLLDEKSENTLNPSQISVDTIDDPTMLFKSRAFFVPGAVRGEKSLGDGGWFFGHYWEVGDDMLIYKEICLNRLLSAILQLEQKPADRI